MQNLCDLKIFSYVHMFMLEINISNIWDQIISTFKITLTYV